MWVHNASFNVVCNENERTMFNSRKKLLYPLRHITSNTNKDGVILKMLQSTNIVTLMLAYINSALVHARQCTGMYLMPSE